jgi:hypothetical protein
MPRALAACNGIADGCGPSGTGRPPSPSRAAGPNEPHFESPPEGHLTDYTESDSGSSLAAPHREKFAAEAAPKSSRARGSRRGVHDASSRVGRRGSCSWLPGGSRRGPRIAYRTGRLRSAQCHGAMRQVLGWGGLRNVQRDLQFREHGLSARGRAMRCGGEMHGVQCSLSCRRPRRVDCRLPACCWRVRCRREMHGVEPRLPSRRAPRIDGRLPA